MFETFFTYIVQSLLAPCACARAHNQFNASLQICNFSNDERVTLIANSRSRKTFYFSLFDSSIFALVLLDLTIWTIYKFFRFNWISSSWASFIHAPTLAYALESQRSLDQHRRLSKIQFFSSLDGSNPDIEKQIFEAKPRRQQNKNLKQLASYGNKIRVSRKKSRLFERKVF